MCKASEAQARLPAHLEARIRRVWLEALGASGLVADGGIEFVERDDLDAVVSVALFGTRLVAAPPDLMRRLRRLDPEQLLDARVVASALGPAAVPIGTATLSYLAVAPPPGSRETSTATATDLTAVRTACTEEEDDESGVGGMPHAWASTAAGSGATVAVSGFDPWHSEIAQLGVLTHPEHRGGDHAYSAASAAVSAALERGLIPQWRSRTDNESSHRLAARLGFITVGAQCAVALG